ncbi:NAD(+) synthase [Thermicanus aegyptius]|uniref:NAD(+) synthase n=1 Tax=Thermicanus aegyptius TaxID=94009 RepID=UPI0004200D06|nr:NAD(+) synthase [Thermicanus aegyptius]
MDRFLQFIQEYRENLEEDLERRLHFIREQVLGNGLNGAVVGISGGIDSAVTAALCIRALGRDRVVGVWMPAYSQEVHGEDAAKLKEAIGLNLVTVNLNKAYDAIIQSIEEAVLPLNDMARGNTKARLRMTTLYAIANQKGYLVADTCNASEIYVGYMTKGGDGLADFNAIATLTKTQIRILAEYLGIPESIRKKPPTADLWADQTDEGEMGFTYEDLDRYIITGEADPRVKERIDTLHRISEHKRSLMPGI